MTTIQEIAKSTDEYYNSIENGLSKLGGYASIELEDSCADYYGGSNKEGPCIDAMFGVFNQVESMHKQLRNIKREIDSWF